MFVPQGASLRSPIGGRRNPRLGGVRNPRTGEHLGTGWMPDLPDLRDLNPGSNSLAEMLEKTNLADANGDEPEIPSKVDLSQWCSPVESQGQIGSCTAQAVVGMVEYFQRRAHGKHVEGSRLFVYKCTRNLMGVTGDTGAFLRQAMAALVLCGVVPEGYWPYTDDMTDFDKEPDSFAYALADNYQAVKYFCHDPFGSEPESDILLFRLRKFLAAGVPFVFGFYGFPSSDRGSVDGAIPYPGPDEGTEWGHAVMAVGYDDKLKIKNKRHGNTTVGALKFRNSWGEDWGDGGYGWLPYEYVLKGLALDYWSLLDMDWVDTKQFGL